MKKQLGIIVPVYNEEGSISNVLNKWVTKLDSLNINYCIHVYDDGSKDNTKDILRNYASENSSKIIVTSKPNSGHGATILQGYKEQSNNYEWLFQIDSDDEMGPELFDQLWEKRNEYDFIIGYRYGRKQPITRKIISTISRLSVKLLYGRKTIWDVNTPYRLMKTNTFKSIYQTIPDNTFAPNVIISGQVAAEKISYFEIPIPQKERQTGEVSLKKWKLLKAAIDSFCQTIEYRLSLKDSFYIFIFFMLLSTFLKILVMFLGHNYDFDSYDIVANIMERKGNVYVDTYRYNYGPIWFNILYWIKLLCGEHFFRIGVVLFLALCDCGIAFIAWHKKYKIASILFLLSPISIFISGYHNQFDNSAILFALISILILDKNNDKLKWNSILWGAFILGLSIITKHVFAFFLFWFLFRNYNLKKKIALFIIPIAMFLGSFIPYAYNFNNFNIQQLKQDYSLVLKTTKIAKDNNFNIIKIKKELKQEEINHLKQIPACSILKNVFLYKSQDNKIFLNYFTPKIFARFLSPFLFFSVSLMLIGYICRNKSLFQSIIIYMLSLVTFSTAIVDQYLAIPVLATCIYYIPLGIIYNLLIGGLMLYQKVGGTVVWILGTGILFLILCQALKDKIIVLLKKIAKI